MTLAVARVTATGADLNTAAGLDAVAAGFAQWYASRPKDIGNQTRAGTFGAGHQRRRDDRHRRDGSRAARVATGR